MHSCVVMILMIFKPPSAAYLWKSVGLLSALKHLLPPSSPYPVMFLTPLLSDLYTFLLQIESNPNLDWYRHDRAHFIGPKQLQCGDFTITADLVFVAGGGRPAFPSHIDGLSKVPFLTSTEALRLTEVWCANVSVSLCCLAKYTHWTVHGLRAAGRCIHFLDSLLFFRAPPVPLFLYPCSHVRIHA